MAAQHTERAGGAPDPRDRPRPRRPGRRLRSADHRRRPGGRPHQARSTCCAAAPAARRSCSSMLATRSSPRRSRSPSTTIEALANAVGDEPTARLAARHRADEEDAGRAAGDCTWAEAVRLGRRPSFDWDEPAAPRRKPAASRRLPRVTKSQPPTALRMLSGFSASSRIFSGSKPRPRPWPISARIASVHVIERAQSLQENEPVRRRRADCRDDAQRLPDTDEPWPPAAYASTVGATSAASRRSRAPSASSAGRRHERARGPHLAGDPHHARGPARAQRQSEPRPCRTRRTARSRPSRTTRCRRTRTVRRSRGRTRARPRRSPPTPSASPAASRSACCSSASRCSRRSAPSPTSATARSRRASSTSASAPSRRSRSSCSGSTGSSRSRTRS